MDLLLMQEIDRLSVRAAIVKISDTLMRRGTSNKRKSLGQIKKR